MVERGTGRAAALDGFAAGKTGTSQNFRDAWFIGFNEGLVAGVWVGNDDDTPMNNMTGGKLPALIWKDFMTGAMTIAAEGPRAMVAEARADRGSEPQCAYRACARLTDHFEVLIAPTSLIRVHESNVTNSVPCRDVRLWHKTDMLNALTNVRFEWLAFRGQKGEAWEGGSSVASPATDNDVVSLLFGSEIVLLLEFMHDCSKYLLTIWRWCGA